MVKYDASPEKVIKAIERMSRMYKYLDPKRDQELFINKLMRNIRNAGIYLSLGPGFYCDGLSENNIGEISDIEEKFCKEEISEEVARAFIMERFYKIESVITGKMGYTRDEKTGRYVKKEQQENPKKRRRILRR